MPCPPNTRIYPSSDSSLMPPSPSCSPSSTLITEAPAPGEWDLVRSVVSYVAINSSRIFYVLLQLLHWKVLSTSTNLFIWYKMADNRCLIKITQTIRRLCLLISRYCSVCRLLQSFEPSVCGTYLGDRRTSPHRVCTLTVHLLYFIPSPTSWPLSSTLMKRGVHRTSCPTETLPREHKWVGPFVGIILLS